MIRLTSVIVPLILIAQLSAPKGTDANLEDGEWLDRFHQPAYDALMPLDVPGLRAAYRREARERPDDIERYFVIRTSRSSPDQLEATVLFPVGLPITTQLLNIRHRDFKASFESILVQVAVRRFTVNSTACPAIRNRMTALSKLNVSLVDDNMLRIHPPVHRIVVWISAGRINAIMEDGDHALVKWAAETQEALMACGGTSALSDVEPAAKSPSLLRHTIRRSPENQLFIEAPLDRSREALEMGRESAPRSVGISGRL